MSDLADKLKRTAAAGLIAAAAASAAPVAADVSASMTAAELEPLARDVAAVGDSFKPVVTFDPAQRRAFLDKSQTLVLNWHRQKGKDFWAAGVAADDAFARGSEWFIISLTQRQADATFRKVRAFARAIERITGILCPCRDTLMEQTDPETNQKFVFKAREIVFPTGGRIVSLPGRDPDTLAGLTGNVIFTEFALFPKGGYPHWEVIFPLTTRGFRILIISTPRGKTTKYYELTTDPSASYHRTTIWESVAEGWSPIPGEPDWTEADVEDLRKRYGSTKFTREYECEFTGDLDALIRWTLLEQAAALSLGRPFFTRTFTDAIDADGAAQVAAWARTLAASGRRVELGWDPARSRDLGSTAGNVASDAGAGPRHLGLVCLYRNVPLFEQRDLHRRVMRDDPRHVGAGDATGLGQQSNEELQVEFRHRQTPGDGLPISRWEPVPFTGPRKSAMASNALVRFQAGAQTLPPVVGDYAWVAADVYGIQSEEGDDGRLALDEAGNPHLADSHNDVGWSIFLSQYAGGLHPFTKPLPRPLARKPANL